MHHVTATTADAKANFDFYTRVLGLRRVKWTVHQEQPTYNHVFYGNRDGDPGTLFSFFVMPAAEPGGSSGSSILWSVEDERALDYWEERLSGEPIDTARTPGTLSFTDFEGLPLELHVDGRPPRCLADDVPDGHCLGGLAGARLASARPDESIAALTASLGLERSEGWLVGPSGRFKLAIEPREIADTSRAGTVHHVALGCADDALSAWQTELADAGLRPTGVVDHHYFRAVYFTEPAGNLFEISDLSPGLGVDEARRQLGTRLCLPPWLDSMRETLERDLAAIPPSRELVER